MSNLWDWFGRLTFYGWVNLILLALVGAFMVASVIDYDRLAAYTSSLEDRLADIEDALWPEDEQPEPVAGPSTQPAGVAIEAWAHELDETGPIRVGRHAHPDGARARRGDSS